jgi:hypothetical protein
MTEVLRSNLPQLLVDQDVEDDKEDQGDDPVDDQVHVDDIHLDRFNIGLTSAQNLLIIQKLSWFIPISK